MVSFDDITFNKTSIYNGEIVLHNPNLDTFKLIVSYGDTVNGAGPNKNQYQVSLKNNLDKYIQLSDYDDTIGYISMEEINEFINLVKTTVDLNEIKNHFRDNFSDED